MRYRHETEEEGQIDISPLIDMVFILLIFFMVTTTFVKDMKLDLDRPSASTAAAASTLAEKRKKSISKCRHNCPICSASLLKHFANTFVALT